MAGPTARPEEPAWPDVVCEGVPLTTRWLGIALLPRADHTRAAVRLQQSLGGDRPLQPPLSEDGNLSHLTVFQGPFQDSLGPERELARS
ncbi:hypothetical protein AB0393_38015 [Streptomyces cyaneofuscatus]|uniref:hypothetical protein n=1 Tax=Streptomyces cyaneofuscatus TaxID=66883 RepID=UPI00344BAF6E